MNLYGYLNEHGMPRSVNHIVVGNYQIFNPTSEQLIEAGYKPIIYTDCPEHQDGFYFTSKWEEVDGVIKQSWEQHEMPKPSDDEYTKFVKIMTGKEDEINE